MTANLNYEQVVNQPFLYVNNLNVAWASNTTLTVSSGQCRDSTNAFDITVTTASTTINAAVVGANGIDVGSLAASKVYYVHVIYDYTFTHAPAFLLSLSSTAPVLPFGYGAFRQIGVWATNGSSHFIAGFVVGNGTARVFNYVPSVQILTNGQASTDTNIDLSHVVPPINNTRIYCSGEAASSVAGQLVNIKYGSSTLISWSVPVTTVDSYHAFEVLSSLVSNLPVITYATGNAITANIFLNSFDFYI